jgi:hypothetical protein
MGKGMDFPALADEKKEIGQKNKQHNYISNKPT